MGQFVPCQSVFFFLPFANSTDQGIGRARMSERTGSGGATDEVLEDPSTADGFRAVYDRELSVEIRQSDDEDQDAGQLQAVKVKVLVLGDDARPEAVRLEASSEADLFFHYYHTLDRKGFAAMQTQQKLMIEFQDYATVAVRMLNQCIKEPHAFISVMYVHTNGTARLDFVQNMEYKFVELLSVDFVQSPPELIRQQIMYRYALMRSRVKVLHDRLSDVTRVVKLRSPALLQQLQKDSIAKATTPSGRRTSALAPP